MTGGPGPENGGAGGDAAVDYPEVAICPSCGASVPAGGRYVTWCATCGWNAVPTRGEQPAAGARRGWFARTYDARTRRAADEAYERLAGGGRVRENRTPDAVVLGLALTVIAAFVGLVVLVAGWTIAGSGPWHWPGALFGILVTAAIVLAVRGSDPPRMLVDRAGAPRLHDLVDALADETGAPRVRRVLVDAGDNASVRLRLFRRRPDLVIGMSLWTRLSPDQRVGLLGHEMGHLVGRAPAAVATVATAQGLLAAMVRLLRPGGYDLAGMSELGVARGIFGPVAGGRGDQMITAAVQRVLALPALALLWGLSVADAPSRQAREYAADLTAVEVAGTAAVAGLLTRSLSGGGWRTVAGSAARRGEDVWVTLAGLGAPPPHEVERLRRVGAAERLRVDASHPPTHRRLELVLARPASAARPDLDEASRQADRELEPYRRRLTDEVLDHLAHA